MQEGRLKKAFSDAGREGLPASLKGDGSGVDIEVGNTGAGCWIRVEHFYRRRGCADGATMRAVEVEGVVFALLQTEISHCADFGELEGVALVLKSEMGW